MKDIEDLIEKATPLPWHQPTGSGDVAMLKESHGVTIVRCLQRGSETTFPEANAALIAHCVNNFMPLLEALERLTHSARVASTRATGFDKMSLERDSEAGARIIAAAKTIQSSEKEGE